MGLISSLLGGGIVGSIERLGSEWIETNQEKAEAKALMVKTLDPNGKMRRDLSRFSCLAYAFYLFAMVTLSFMVAFNIGGGESIVTASDGTVTTITDGAVTAAGMMQDLFLPITGAWTAIVSASFGVNGVNSFKGR